jgi:hypothetical protein
MTTIKAAKLPLPHVYPDGARMVARPARLALAELMAQEQTGRRQVFEVVYQPPAGTEIVVGRLFRLERSGIKGAAGYLIGWYRPRDGAPLAYRSYAPSDGQVSLALEYLMLSARVTIATALSIPDNTARRRVSEAQRDGLDGTPVGADESPCGLPRPPGPEAPWSMLDQSSYYPESCQFPGALPLVTLNAAQVAIPQPYLPTTRGSGKRMLSLVQKLTQLQSRAGTVAVIEPLPDGHSLIYLYRRGGSRLASRERVPMLEWQAIKVLTLSGHPLTCYTEGEQPPIDLHPVMLPHLQANGVSPWSRYKFAWPHCAWLTREPCPRTEGPHGGLIWHPSRRHPDCVESLRVASDSTNHYKWLEKLGCDYAPEEIPEWVRRAATEQVQIKQRKLCRALEQDLAEIDAAKSKKLFD